MIEKLSTYEARVLGVLIEKEFTLPYIYPLTLHVTRLGCNQKHCREPIYVMLPHEVLRALHGLIDKGLVTSAKSRFTERYSHQVHKVLKLPYAALPFLCLLLLRGPLITGQLAVFSEPFTAGRDHSTIEGFMRMMSRDMDPPLVEQLPLMTGEREQRWSELLTNLRGRTPQGNHVTLESLADQVDFLQDKILDLEIQIAELLAKVP